MPIIGLEHDALMEATKKLASQAIKIEMPINEGITETNMNPFSSYAPLMGELGEQLLQYRRILLNDIDQIRSIGNTLKEMDERISSEIEKNIVDK